MTKFLSPVSVWLCGAWLSPRLQYSSREERQGRQDSQFNFSFFAAFACFAREIFFVPFARLGANLRGLRKSLEHEMPAHHEAHEGHEDRKRFLLIFFSSLRALRDLL
jgi:hypothetical protein